MKRLHLVGILIIGFVAFPLATPGQGADATKIHSCVNIASGTIKIVSAGTTCSANEVPLDWYPASSLSSCVGSDPSDVMVRKEAPNQCGVADGRGGNAGSGDGQRHD